MAASLAALLVLTGCGAQQSGLPEVAGSPSAVAVAAPLPEPTVTVTASVAPEPSVPEQGEQAAPSDPDEPGEPAPEGAAAPTPDEAATPEPDEAEAPEPVEAAPAPAADPLPQPAIDAAEEEISYSLPGVGGTVLEAMDADGLAFEAKGSGENSFITSVGGREADDSAQEYWALYVNGEYAQLGAGSQQASSEDTITWRLERY